MFVSSISIVSSEDGTIVVIGGFMVGVVVMSTSPEDSGSDSGSDSSQGQGPSHCIFCILWNESVSYYNLKLLTVFPHSSNAHIPL